LVLESIHSVDFFDVETMRPEARSFFGKGLGVFGFFAVLGSSPDFSSLESLEAHASLFIVLFVLGAFPGTM